MAERAEIIRMRAKSRHMASGVISAIRANGSWSALGTATVVTTLDVPGGQEVVFAPAAPPRRTAQWKVEIRGRRS